MRPSGKKRNEKLRVLMSLYFAQRDVVAPADERLTELGYGRAHHRVLTFVDQSPGLTVSELGQILRIANQSLNRVLSPLVKQGFIEQSSDPNDLRCRRLYLTEKGRELEEHGFEAQFKLIDAAMKRAGPDAFAGFVEFSQALMDEEDRLLIARLLA
jgi:DNA-binding MarR family transcriptional regulator